MVWRVLLFGCGNVSVQGNSGEKRMFSPKRAYLAQARIAEQARSTLELSLRRRALVWARHLAQARGTHLSEIAWGLWLSLQFSAQARDFVFNWGDNSLRRGGTRLSENSRFQQPSMLVFSPKRGPAVWAKEAFAWARLMHVLGWYLLCYMCVYWWSTAWFHYPV